MPQLLLMDRPGAACLSSTSRLNRKRALQRLYHLDGHHEQTLKERTTRMSGVVAESADDRRASDSEGSEPEWHSTRVTVMQLTPAAEAVEDLAHFNFRDDPRSAVAAGQDASLSFLTQP